MSRRRAGLDAPASTTTRTGRSARAGRVVTGMVAGRGGAVGATIAMQKKPKVEACDADVDGGVPQGAAAGGGACGGEFYDRQQALDAHHGRSWPLLKVVVAVITLGVARKAEDGVELALARGRLALDVSLRKPCFLYAKFGP